MAKKGFGVEIDGLKQLRERIIKGTESILSNIDRIEIVSLKTIEALHKRRIFNASKASDGTSLGGYNSPQYKQFRLRNNKLVGKKDLQFSGDLRLSMDVGRFSGRDSSGRFIKGSRKGNVYKFTTDLARKIMQGQERKNQVGKVVLELTDQEVDIGIEAYFDGFEKIIKGL